MKHSIVDFDILLKDFGVKSEEDLLKKRTTEKQNKPADIIENPKLVPMTVDQCKRMCEKVKLEYHPGYEKRVIERITTTEAPDRYGDIVRAKGANIESYKKNPVVMFAHQHSAAPIGKSIKLWMDSSINGWRSQDLHFGNELDSTGYYDYLFKMVASGAMPGGSIGFLPSETKSDYTTKEREEMGLGRYGVEYLGWDYLEHSACAIPANPEALANSLKSIGAPRLRGFFGKDDLLKMESLKLFDGNTLDAFALALGIEKTIVDVSVKAVIPYMKHTDDPEEEAWDAGAETKKADAKQLKMMCTWYDAEKPDLKTSYKLPHHRAESYHTVWAGVKAAMGALLGARGGVDIPEGDKHGCYLHLSKHYEDFKKTAPDMKAYSAEELLNLDFEIEIKEPASEKSIKEDSVDFSSILGVLKAAPKEGEPEPDANDPNEPNEDDDDSKIDELLLAAVTDCIAACEACEEACDKVCSDMEEMKSKMSAMDDKIKILSLAQPTSEGKDDVGLALHEEILKAATNIFNKG